MSRMNVAMCFARLLSRIQPSDAEIKLAQSHLGAVTGRLKSTFKLKRVLIGGSYCRKTLVRGASDVDVFAVIARADVMWGGRYQRSETILNHFRNELALRYPHTPVRRDVHAVVVHFSKGPCVDVVPAIFDQMMKGRPQYLIPDGEGEWMAASPESHNRYIDVADVQSRHKLKRVAKLMKYWRQCSSTRGPLSSFHIEMLLASTEVCKGVKSYAACLNEALQNLSVRECRALQDPVGISGLIPAVKTQSQLEDALCSVKYARDHARNACIADYAGDTAEAWRQWNIVFKGNFPR